MWRDEFERRLIRAVARANSGVRREIAALLGDPPTLDALTPEVWDDIMRRMGDAMRPDLEEAFLEAGARLMTTLGVSIDDSIINRAAMEWARTYSYELVRGMNDRRQRDLQNLFGSFFEQPMSNEELQRYLVREFGPVRAEMIGITEVTRAISEGEKRVVDTLQGQGVGLVAVWQTMEDERVCPICGPRNDQAQGTNWINLPPAHPRCRCLVRWEMMTL